MGRSGKEHLQSNGNSLCKGPGTGPRLECLRNREEASGWSEQGKEGGGGVREGWGAVVQGLVGQDEGFAFNCA